MDCSDDQSTTFYVPNDWVDQVCTENPDCFEMAMSVHPYREDALEEMEKWANKGVKIIKCIQRVEYCKLTFSPGLPNSQMIDLEHGGRDTLRN